MAGANTVSAPPDGAHLTSCKRRPFGCPPELEKPKPAPLPRQLTHEEFAERWLALPEVEQLQKVPWSKLERLLLFYDWLWRGARARGSGAIDTSLAQAAAGAGGISITSVWRYAGILERMGLASMGGLADRSGRTRCSQAQLLDPDLHSGASARSSAGSSDGRRRCRLEKVPESRQERAQRRHKPHRRRSGRSDTHPRYRPRPFFGSAELKSPVGGSGPLRGPDPKQLESPYVREGAAAVIAVDGRSEGSEPLQVAEGLAVAEGPAVPGTAAEQRASEDGSGRVAARLAEIAAAAAAGGCTRSQLVEAFELRSGVPARFSWRRWGPAFDVVLRRLDRYWPYDRLEPPTPRRRGAAARCVLEYLEQRLDPSPVDWGERGQRPPPKSFVLIVLELDELSRSWRRMERLRTDPAYRQRARPPSGATPRRRRQRVKPRQVPRGS